MPVLYIEKPPPQHHWRITVNAASDNQSAANAVEHIELSHR
jgi:hypothetical protein